MSVNVSIKLDNSKIETLINASKEAFKLTVDDIFKDILDNQVVPKKTGRLERSGQVDLSEVENLVASIIFDTPYARRLYWHPEYNFRTIYNKNAQGKWMHMYIDGGKKEFIVETYSKHFKELSRGLIT